MSFLLARTVYLILLAGFLFVVAWGALEIYRKFRELKQKPTGGKSDEKIIADINNLDVK